MRFEASDDVFGRAISSVASRLSGRVRRFQYLGDMLWLAKLDLLTGLAVTTEWMIPYLLAGGLPASSVVFGVPKEWGADLGLERDVPVLWLGNPATRRRKRLLQTVRHDLKAKDIPILMIDGIENPYVYGDERTVSVEQNPDYTQLHARRVGQ